MPRIGCQGTEIDFAYGDVPLPQAVRPLVLLHGSDREMGAQYYQQLIQIFGSWILERVAYDRPTAVEEQARSANEDHIRQWTPELLEMIQGMAEGATSTGFPLTYDQVLTHFLKDCSERLARPIDCSGFAAWGRATGDGRLVAGGCGDHQLTFEITLAVYPNSGNSYIISPFWPTVFSEGGHPGMNNRGLAYVHHGATHWIRSRPESEWTDGLPEGFAILHNLRFADGAKEAERMQFAYPSGDGFIGGFWADTRGDAFIIESRDKPKAVRYSGDCGEADFLYATNNALHKELGHCQASPSKGTVYIPHGGWLGTGTTISSVPRNLEMWNMLHHYQGRVDVEFAKMMWRFAGQAPMYPTLEEADAAYYLTQGKGWDQRIGNLLNAAVGVVQPDDGDRGRYWISNGAVARRAFPHVPQGHHYRISPTHTFYELQLAATPEAMVEAVRERAQYDLYYTNLELRGLSLRDPAKAPLGEAFARAATEWHVGEHYLDPVFMPKDRNGVVHRRAKSIRAFARCQAYARQVFETLVSPPCNPSDLGLLPWEYWTKDKVGE
jgi:hypothetical protein